MPQAATKSADDHAIAEAETTDWGKDCALRHNTLVDSVNKHNKEAADGGR